MCFAFHKLQTVWVFTWIIDSRCDCTPWIVLYHTFSYLFHLTQVGKEFCTYQNLDTALGADWIVCVYFGVCVVCVCSNGITSVPQALRGSFEGVEIQ